MCLAKNIGVECCSPTPVDPAVGTDYQPWLWTLYCIIGALNDLTGQQPHLVLVQCQGILIDQVLIQFLNCHHIHVPFTISNGLILHKDILVSTHI